MKEKVFGILTKFQAKIGSRRRGSASAFALALCMLTVSAFASDGGGSGSGGASISTITSGIGDILTSALGWVAQVVAVVTGNPLILFFVILGGIYIGVNMLRKLLHV